MKKVAFVATIVLAVAGSLLYSFSVVSWAMNFLMIFPLVLLAAVKFGTSLADGTWGGPP